MEVQRKLQNSWWNQTKKELNIPNILFLRSDLSKAIAEYNNVNGE
jgi:hypothetical protein